MITLRLIALTLLCTLAAAAPAQDAPETGVQTPRVEDQISTFVRRIHHDSQGNYWFGTNGDGVIRYQPEASLPADIPLEYFSPRRGFGGHAVRAIVEDTDGNIWFGTSGGLTRYDGTQFTTFTEKDGLLSDDIWCLAIDTDGLIWIGTFKGATRFDGTAFTPFELPESHPDPTRGVTSPWIVHSIIEDSTGRMWFATNGGVYIHDGTTLEHLSTMDGLCHNVVNCILEDRDGNFWFATHHNGVCRWDGTTVTHVSEKEGVRGTEAWSLFEDSNGHIWFPTEGHGVYRYDGTSFRNYGAADGLASGAVQCVHEDRAGRIWVGGYLGLYRLEGDVFVNVTREGPWE